MLQLSAVTAATILRLAFVVLAVDIITSPAEAAAGLPNPPYKPYY